MPRIARLMALALKLDELLQQGAVRDYASLAALGRVSRARLTQILNLRNLSPDIQGQLLFIPEAEAKRSDICEASIRRLSSVLRWGEQRARWAVLLSGGADLHR